MSKPSIKKTTHYVRRIQKRSIREPEAYFTLQYGDIRNDKFFTNRKILQKLKNELDIKIKKLISLSKKYKGYGVQKIIMKALNATRKLRSVAMKSLDKGGVTVVYDNNSLITAYQTNSYKSY
ncbi:hypothetical protein [Acinetobacter sp.]|uniref:hypothetical protein n=1 Tax=Acinetobacter sp. TaxID=472 RepID=UPI0028AB565F|nr:hypothetical protein [Acinetobacter sp.]